MAKNGKSRQKKTIKRLRRENLKLRKQAYAARIITENIPDPNKRLYEIPQVPPIYTESGPFYDARDRVLRDLGYKSYDAYLHSHDWAVIRRRVLCLDRGLCRCCGGPATEVHHSAYNSWALRGIDLSCLHSICHQCHEMVEFDFGMRRSPVEAVSTLRSLIVATKRKTERKWLDQRAIAEVPLFGSHQPVVLSSLPTENSSGIGPCPAGEIQATSQCNA